MRVLCINVGGIKLWQISKNIALVKKLWQITNLGDQAEILGHLMQTAGRKLKLWWIEVRQNIKTTCKTLQRIAAPQRDRYSTH